MIDDESPYAEDVGLSGYRPWRGRELRANQPQFTDHEMSLRVHLWGCLVVVLAGVGFIVWLLIEISKVAQ